MKKIRFALFALAFGVAMPSVAFAGDEHGKAEGAKEGNKDKKEEKKELKEKKEELKDALKSGDAGAAQAAKEDLDKMKDEIREKHKAHMAELRKKWGEMLKNPAVKEEMRLHASRVAKLHRIDELAKADKKDAIAKRAEDALAKEKTRHEKRMEALKADGGATAAGSVGSTPPTAPKATGGGK
jgi:hypothetical protein